MKTTKKFLSIILSIIMLISAVPVAFAADTTLSVGDQFEADLTKQGSDNLTFRYVFKVLSLPDAENEYGKLELVRPAEGVYPTVLKIAMLTPKITYDGVTFEITSIGDMAFDSGDAYTAFGRELQEVNLMLGTVENIGNEAFANCEKLEEVIFAPNVSKFVIGEYAFANCEAITSLYIQANGASPSVEIGQAAFSACRGLKELDLGSTVSKLGVGAFITCDSLTTVTFGGNKLTEIPGWCFANTAIESIAIPEGVTAITGEAAFYECNSLKSVELPSTIKTVANEAGTFINCPLERVVFKGGETVEFVGGYPLPLLTVENGYGDGLYANGQEITITANEKEGYDFVKWEITKGDGTLADASATETTYTMGSSETIITPVYIEEPIETNVYRGFTFNPQSQYICMICGLGTGFKDCRVINVYNPRKETNIYDDDEYNFLLDIDVLFEECGHIVVDTVKFHYYEDCLNSDFADNEVKAGSYDIGYIYSNVGSDHVLGDIVTNKNSHTAECKYCKHKETIDCEWGEWEVSGDKHIRTCTISSNHKDTHTADMSAGTCIEKGKCSVDGCDVTTESTAGHNYSSWTTENGMHYRLCTYDCGTKENDPVKCSGGEATCISLPECETCGETYGEVDLNNHKCDISEYESNGEENHKVIYQCGYNVNEGHIFTIYTETTPADCRNNAKETGTCICKATHTREIENSMKEHSFNFTDTEKAVLTRPVNNSDGTFEDGYYIFTCQNDNCDATTKVTVKAADYTEFDNAVKEAKELMESINLCDSPKNSYIDRLDVISSVAYSPIRIESEQGKVNGFTASVSSLIDEMNDGVKDGSIVKADFSAMEKLFSEIDEIIGGDTNKITEYKLKLYTEPLEYYNSVSGNGNYSQKNADTVMPEHINTLETLKEGLLDGSMIKPDYTKIDALLAEIDEMLKETEVEPNLLYEFDKLKSDVFATKHNTTVSQTDVDNLRYYEKAERIKEAVAEAIENSKNNDDEDKGESDCDHMCHKTGFVGFIWKIVQFFWKLFRMNPVCECGVAHY